MSNERKKGIQYSAALHVALLLIIILGLPSFFSRERDEEPMVITVDILPISAQTNVKPSQKQAEKKPEEKQKKTEQKETESKPSEEKPTEKPTPKTVTEDSTPEPTPKLDDKKAEKKEEKKKEKKEEKKKEEDLEAVLKAVKETAQQQKSEPTEQNDDSATDTQKNNSTQYNPDLPLSLSERDAIRSQIAKCWIVPAGAKDAYSLIVTLRIQLNSDGSVVDAQLATDQMRYQTDGFFRAAADSAIRAVWKCSPLQNLPPDKYNTWKDMELTFDPKEMLY